MEQIHDKRGVPIHPGDLLKTPHFTDRRGKKHFLYHVAVRTERGLDMVPVSHLEPSKVGRFGQCGRCQIDLALAMNLTIIDGYGPGGCLDYTDRTKLSSDLMDLRSKLVRERASSD